MKHATTTFRLKRATLTLALLLAALAPLAFAQGTAITILCDDKENLPYFADETKAGFANKPGAVIEFVKSMEKDLDLKVTILRMPIAKAIAVGIPDAHAVFCVPYDAESSFDLAFPMDGTSPDESYALYRIPFGLYRPAASPLSWDEASGKPKGLPAGKAIGITYGSEMAGALAAKGIAVKPGYSSILSAFAVMAKGEIAGVIAREPNTDAVLAADPDLAKKVTKADGLPGDVPCYVAFRKDFAAKNPALVKSIHEYVKMNRLFYKKQESWYLKRL